MLRDINLSLTWGLCTVPVTPSHGRRVCRVLREKIEAG